MNAFWSCHLIMNKHSSNCSTLLMPIVQVGIYSTHSYKWTLSTSANIFSAFMLSFDKR